jgi:hypothetical protein
MATPNVSALVIFLAIVTSSSRLAGTRGLPSALARPASLRTFTFM